MGGGATNPIPVLLVDVEISPQDCLIKKQVALFPIIIVGTHKVEV